MKKNNEKEKPDWFDELTEEQLQSVLIGLEQADRGEFIPHEEAMKKLVLIDPPHAKNSNK
jgi:predicted transcriptional regulator